MRIERAMNPEILKPFAKRYIWWKTPEEAVEMPYRVMAQVMNIGDWDDVCALSRLVGDDVLRDVLKTSEAGWFNPRSWNYWHIRLYFLSDDDQVPPMPIRKFD